MAGSKSDTILVILVTYEGTPWLKECLSPFVEDREGLDILVIDNASSDGTADAVRRDYPFAEVRESLVNLGFGKANNLGLEKAVVEGYRGVFLLNQDASVTAETIRTLADRTDRDTTIGIASPVHYRDRECSAPEKGFGHYLEPLGAVDFRKEDFLQLPFINAALWYLPMRTLHSVGLFCPLFAHYGEDLDYAERVLFSGQKIGFFPDLRGIHFRKDEPLNPKKKHILDHAYRLSRLVHPSLSPLKRFSESVLKPAVFSISKEDDFYMGTAVDLWRTRETARLWRSRPPLDFEGLKRAYGRKDFAPVLLLVYNRPRHTAKLLEDFFANPEAGQTPLHIVQDGGSGEEWEEVQAICQKAADGRGLVTFTQNAENKGLAENVTSSVTRLFRRYDRLIVLEDDLRLSPYFLRWMNDVLELYEGVPEVAHVHAGTFYASGELRNNHLLRFAGSWGWATWRDRWEKYWEPDGLKLLRAVEAQPELKAHFDYGGFQKFTRMLRRQTLGENNSWAVRWHASLLLHGLLSVNSSPALVRNAGFDGTGVHSSGDDRFHTAVSPYPLYAEKRPPVEDEEAYGILKRYYTWHNNKAAKGYYKLKELWRRLFG